ncbi:neuropeptide SIFamide receptor-like isoform X2 [Dendronephthya gigantea]|nr:neuropeptide SIFamide receptor-like isoform X2 [Dendronephthya gigantea]XP_028413513.1 neuropeptide SIFamide receptor-like isoform X2 [Dendronephthya gigantea]
MSNNTTEKPDEFAILTEGFRKDQLVAFCIIFVIGLGANSMVLFNGIRRRKLIKHFSNDFVVSMAFADFGVIVFTIPLMFVEYLLGFKGMNTFICTYIVPIRETFQGASIFSVVTLAILRVRQVTTQPFKQFSKKTSKILVVAIWIISALFFTFSLYDGIYIITEDGICDPKWPNLVRLRIHITIINCIFISPLVVATISYGFIILKVTNLNIGSDPESERLTKRNRSIAMLMIVLILSCWITYTPLTIYLFLGIYSDIEQDPQIWRIVSVLFIGGSALNPVLVLLTMPKDYRFDIECKRQRRVGVDEPNAVQNEIVKSTIRLQDRNGVLPY